MGEFRRFIDPPGGWKQGFPKVVPEDVFNDWRKLKQWFLDNGYPENSIDLALNYSWSWIEEIEQDTPSNP